MNIILCLFNVLSAALLSVISLPSFLTAQCGLQFSPRGLRPSCSLMTARHLDENTMGYLQWRWGPNSAMTTSLVRDTKSSHFTLALQVHTNTSTDANTLYVCRHINMVWPVTDIQLSLNILNTSCITSLRPLPAGCASLLPDDELPVQVSGWGPDQS